MKEIWFCALERQTLNVKNPVKDLEDAAQE
jgi:hypothetical protein